MNSATQTETAETTQATDAILLVIASINIAKLPAGFAPSNIRSLLQTERTARIRSMLRTAGVKLGAVGKGVSVTSDRGSMCWGTSVDFEGVDHETSYLEHNRLECTVCSMNRNASRKLEALVLEAFPDLVDRSDLMTDHFDSVFSIGTR